MGTWVLSLSSDTSSMRFSHLFLALRVGVNCVRFGVALSPHHKWSWYQNWEELNRGCNDPGV